MKIARTVVVLLAACPLTGIDARPSGAEIYRPWCVIYSGRDGARTCSFSSFEQCMMTATPGTAALACRTRGICGTARPTRPRGPVAAGRNRDRLGRQLPPRWVHLSDAVKRREV